MPKKNPIERRVDMLHDQWSEFAQDAEARLLVWLVEPREAPMVQAFVHREQDPEACDTPDTFLRFTDAFTLHTAHGFVLRSALIEQYTQASQSLAAQGIACSWRCPYAKRDDDDIAALVDALQSFHAHHGGQRLAIWLDPSAVSDTREYLLWLQRLVYRMPVTLRVMVLDASSAPSLAPLSDAEPMRVTTTRAQLDMPAALAEVSQQAGQLDTPGGQLRQWLVALGNAASEGDLALSRELAERAAAHALGAGWPHLAAVAHMTLAAVHNAHGQHLCAVQAYTEAERLGAHASAAPAPARGEDDVRAYGPRVRLSARLGQGAALIAMAAWDKAAEVFLHAVPLAEQVEDPRAQLDALRLASFCYEQAADWHKAWDAGMRALAVAAAVDDTTRRTSSLAYLGQALLRLTAREAAYAAHAAPLERRLVAWLGPDWRPDPAREARPEELPSFVDAPSPQAAG